jgi:hypothetical protein
VVGAGQCNTIYPPLRRLTVFNRPSGFALVQTTAAAAIIDPFTRKPSGILNRRTAPDALLPCLTFNRNNGMKEATFCKCNIS